ncbi:hypothetical protein [Pedobacter sp.]|jgi:hypothetical protein|uniref:hypothetical protein n=1 Tax=Pedobacter sp. TaxID=1411316 RepID=UPI002CAD1CB9|nr:hypothetical protein [Pedobacter sp.]HWW40883.1 hypothetical protein [Pedobacter sp.]
MMLKKILLLVTCLLGSVLTVVLLCFFSGAFRHNKNNFVRLLPPFKVKAGNILDFKIEGCNFAGYSRDSIYIGNLYTPDRLVKVDSGLRDTLAVKLGIPDRTKLTKGYTNLVTDNSVYILDGNQPLLLKGNNRNRILKPASKPPYFTQAIHSGGSSFVLRVVQAGQNKLVTYKTDSAGFRMPANLLEKQVDGIFCTDGNLVKVPNSKKVIYVYYYRNQFLCADDNLNLLYKGKTIDTVSRAHIKVDYIKSLNETTISSPPLYVNKQSAANEKYLFVHSALMADNEVAESLDKVSVIDVYAVKDGKYQFSFYLPDFRGNKIRDFRVYGQSLYALYDHYLYKYQLNF